MQVASENGARRRGREQVTDLYIRGPKLAAAEPRRVVVELEPSEYQALEAACRGRCITAPELVRIVALRLAGATISPVATAVPSATQAGPRAGRAAGCGPPVRSLWVQCALEDVGPVREVAVIRHREERDEGVPGAG